MENERKQDRCTAAAIGFALAAALAVPAVGELAPVVRDQQSVEPTARPKIVTVAELSRLRGRLESPVVVYFDPRQWVRLTRRAQGSIVRPRTNGVRLELSEIGGLPGGVGVFKCPPGSGGPYFGLDGYVHCRETLDVEPPRDESGGSLEPMSCGMLLRDQVAPICGGWCTDGRSCSVTESAVPQISGDATIAWLGCGCPE